MALVADADEHVGLGGTRLDFIAAGAANFRFHVFRMYVCLHKKGAEKLHQSPGVTSGFLRK